MKIEFLQPHGSGIVMRRKARGPNIVPWTSIRSLLLLFQEKTHIITKAEIRYRDSREDPGPSLSVTANGSPCLRLDNAFSIQRYSAIDGLEILIPSKSACLPPVQLLCSITLLCNCC